MKLIQHNKKSKARRRVRFPAACGSHSSTLRRVFLEDTMNKVTITKATGTGILTKAADGKWDIEINGQQGGSLHYTQDQVDKIIAAARAKGEIITAE